MKLMGQASSDDGLTWLVPDWPAPAEVRAASTLRSGGVSEQPYQGLNLGDHVGDELAHVRENRTRLAKALRLPEAPCWLTQVHGTAVIDAGAVVGINSGGHLSSRACPEADAAFTSQPDTVCAVLTADCLPLLFCDRAGTRVAAVHAGWRGLAAGVVEAAVQALDVPMDELLVWLGPAIGPTVFEVGAEVRTAFIASDSATQQAFHEVGQGHYMADLYLLARLRLQRLGIEAIYGGQWCTYSQHEDFYSFRRDGTTGRMASLIWMA